MSTEDLELRYAEVCQQLAVCLQKNERLQNQVSNLKLELAASEDFIQRMMERNQTWENENLTEPPHHINSN